MDTLNGLVEARVTAQNDDGTYRITRLGYVHGFGSVLPLKPGTYQVGDSVKVLLHQGQAIHFVEADWEEE